MDEEKKIFAPDGSELMTSESSPTNREIERRQEDKESIPVILKRNDEAVRHPDDILKRAISEGLEQHKRKVFSLFLSAIAAGLILGFAGMCVALVHQMVPVEENFLFNRLAVALVYPLGFIVCIMSGTQLFTEHTATAVYPVLDKKVRFGSLFSLWFTVLAGNLVGTFICSLLIYISDPVILASKGYVEVAHHLTSFSGMQVFISAILAGWLMAQAGWLILATPPASSQIICVYIVTFIIGLGGLHHSIAGSAEIFSGLLNDDHKNYLGSLKFLGSSIVGNLFGGSLFVGVLNYGQVKTQ